MGSLDGQGHAVSNASITGIRGYGGLFPRANGATIRNLVVDNITISTSDRAGGLIGRVENGDTLVENVVIKNSSITGNNSNGVGGLIGIVSRKTDVYNVSVINTTVTNTSQANVGGLVGRVDSAALYADDIFILGVTVKSGYVHTTIVGAGALVGYVRDNANSLFSGVRVVVWNTTVDGDVTRAFIGRLSAPGQADLMDAYFKVTFDNNERSNLVDYNQTNNEVTPVVDTTYIYGSLTNQISAGANEIALTNIAVPTDAAWWTTNLNNIATSDFWVVNSDGLVTLALLVE